MTAAISPLPTRAEPAAILLHGLGLGGWAMHRIATDLERQGYRVVNLSYHSRQVTLETLATQWLPAQLTQHEIGLAEGDPPLHFVTHSMGGIVLRGWLRHRGGSPPALHRVVMFAPPNQGSSLVDRIGNWWTFRTFTGINGSRLSTASDSYPNQQGSWPTGSELGIIAGNQPINPLLAHWTGSPGDGKVRVTETRLDGMTDHIVMPYSHTWIQYRQPAIDQVSAFLQTGKFQR